MKKQLFNVLLLASVCVFVLFSCEPSKTIHLKIDSNVAKNEVDIKVVEQWNRFIDLSGDWIYDVDKGNMADYKEDIEEAFDCASETGIYLMDNEMSPEFQEKYYEKAMLFEEEMNKTEVSEELNEMRYAIFMPKFNAKQKALKEQK